METFEHVQNLAMDTTDKSYSAFICFILKLCVLYTFCIELVRYVSLFGEVRIPDVATSIMDLKQIHRTCMHSLTRLI